MLLRKSLFKTRCKVVGKCYKVLIDSGSSDNLALEELVTKDGTPKAILDCMDQA